VSDDRFQDPTVFRKPKAEIPAEEERESWISLEAWLFKRFEEGQARSPEVQTFVQLFGRNKMLEFYEKWKTLKRRAGGAS
jgi:hypothetical protein